MIKAICNFQCLLFLRNYKNILIGIIKKYNDNDFFLFIFKILLILVFDFKHLQFVNLFIILTNLVNSINVDKCKFMHTLPKL